MMKLFQGLFLLLSLFVLVSSCKKDELTEAYVRGGNSITSATDGNILIAGFNMVEGSGYDGYLLKVDQAGNILWGKNYGNRNTDGFNKIIPCSEGGYAVTGFVSNSSDYYSSLVVMKVDEQGELIWSTLSADTSVVRGYGLTETTDHGFLACGYIKGYDDMDRDIYLLRLDDTGKIEWKKRYGEQGSASSTAENDEAFAVVTDGNEGFYITGSEAGANSCCGKAFLMRLDADGDSLWKKSYDFYRGISLSRTADGNLLVCGIKESNGQDIKVIKTDEDGELIWEKTIGGSGYEFGSSVMETADGGVAICGITAASGNSSQSVALYKLNAAGTQLWSATFGENDVNQGTGLIQTADGGFYITGLSNDGGSYVFLNKTDANGNEIWRKLLKQ